MRLLSRKLSSARPYLESFLHQALLSETCQWRRIVWPYDEDSTFPSRSALFKQGNGGPRTTRLCRMKVEALGNCPSVTSRIETLIICRTFLALKAVFRFDLL